VNLFNSERVQTWASKHVRCRVEGVPDRFSLSFDDGPSPRYTPQVMETLARFGARATFFVLAGRAGRSPELIRRQHEAGHEVGAHGRVHLPPPLFTTGWLEAEIGAAAAAVEAACGVRPRRYRAPFGFLTPEQARRVRAWGYEPVLGDDYPDDPLQKDPALIAERALARLRPGSIVILHDSSVFGDASRAPTIEAVERILIAAEARGLRSVSIEELVQAGEERTPRARSVPGAATQPFV